MTYVMLPDLRVILFFVYPIIESFEKVFICCLAVGYIIIYRTTIILNALDKITNCIELKIVESWST